MQWANNNNGLNYIWVWSLSPSCLWTKQWNANIQHRKLNEMAHCVILRSQNFPIYIFFIVFCAHCFGKWSIWWDSVARVRANHVLVKNYCKNVYKHGLWILGKNITMTKTNLYISARELWIGSTLKSCKQLKYGNHGCYDR